MLSDNNHIFRNCFVIIYCRLTKVLSQINKGIIFEGNALSITLSTLWYSGRSTKCPFGQVSVGQLTVGQFSVDQVSVGEVSVGQVSVVKCPSAKCPSGKCPSGKCPSTSTTCAFTYLLVSMMYSYFQ